MNQRQLIIAFRQESRKYALRFSLILHGIGILAFSLFFIRSQGHEIEDEIHLDILPQLSRQESLKKKSIPKTETQTPIKIQETPIEKKKRTSQKQIKAIEPKASLEIAKMPASLPAAADTQPVAKIDVTDLPTALEAPNVSTAADLKPVAESVLSPMGADAQNTAEKTATRRSDTRVRTPGKRSPPGIAKHKTGATAEPHNATESATAGIGQGNNAFRSIIQQLTGGIIRSSGGGPIDVVFVVDASGTMGDNINAVAEHLIDMIDAYKASEIDYRLGLTHFNVNQLGKNNIQVWQLKRNLAEYKRSLYAIIPTGDENALDAIQQTLSEMRLRSNTTKHFILVTDEPFTSAQGLTVEDVITGCRNNKICVNVLGNNIPEHKKLATQTGGTWHAIPHDLTPKKATQQQIYPQTPLGIGEKIRHDAANLPTDIIFFIDGSKSMEDNMTFLQENIDLWIRNWDNARIDYRIGVVRFRASSSMNIINVFNPPQTQKQIHAILQLPPADDENLIHAFVEGSKRLEIRPNAKTHFIVFTDEPGNPKYPFTGTIELLKEIPVVVSVIGTNDNFQQQAAWQTGGIWVAIPNAQKTQQLYH